ncbi:MAG: argininosuccinate synthase, partial [Candidatus Hydrothermarchaeota archaeon]|nr:argininosuccinate synthase [Candidatus Hydrothermarchaeota archaeon]
FAQDYIFKAIKANASYEGYPLSTALARPLIAAKVVEVAKKEKADALAHGATGKGNDQFRFEAVFRSTAPEMKIIAPVRELNLTRVESIAYAKDKEIPVPVDVDKPYSVDKNLWGRSVEGGLLEDPNAAPPEEVFKWTRLTYDKPETLEIEFKEGVPIAINGEKMSPAELIGGMNSIAGKHGVGRIDIMEDRILGIKARENYECPAAVALLIAHKQLEQLVLTRQELKFKETVEQEWSELVYTGLWTEPLRHALDAFIDETQERVTGTVKVKLHQGFCGILARSSPFALYSEKLASFDDNTLDQRSVEGMLSYHVLQASLYEKLKKKR